jgi:hypothetical protein
MTAPSSPRLAAQPKPTDRSWRDHLLMLLHVGAELEHSLMVQYLYGAYSLGGPQVPDKHRHDVNRWRDAILTVAREEMGHLLCIQNLITLLGGKINLYRSDYPWDSPYYPFRFSLEPLTMKSLSCYVFAEMEPDMPNPVQGGKGTKRGKEFDKDIARIRAAATEAAGGHPHHVGEIYEPILELLSDPTKIPDSDFNASSYAYQSNWDEWGKSYKPTPDDQDAARQTPHHQSEVMVFQMATRTQAVEALKKVAGQGEAPHLLGRPTEEPSHFDRFVGVYQGFEKVEGWKATRDCPVNPTTVLPEGKKSSQTYIESAQSREWASLFNLRYRMLLTNIAHTYRLQRTTDPNVPNMRSGALHRTFGEMYNVKTLSELLFRLPLTDDPKDLRRAGPPFQMPYSLELPDTEADCLALHRDLLNTSAGLAEAIGKHATGDGLQYLQTLSGIDRQAVQWLDTVLGNKGGRRS